MTDNKQMQDIKKWIRSLSDEDALRELRDYSDEHLQDLKERKARSSKAEIEEKYRDKYLVFYGRHVAMTSRVPNMNDITIVHVLDVDFVGRGFFRCHVREIHIKYDDEWNQVSHLTSDWGSAYISCSDDTQYDIRENEIDGIIDREKVMEIVGKARENCAKIADMWDT